MRICTILLAGMLTVRALAAPELTGTPDQLAAHLSALPGLVTLAAEAELKVEADTAEATVQVSSTDRSFEAGLRRNQDIRSDLIRALVEAGVPADRVSMSRFSSVPAHGFLTGKVKSYRIESNVTVRASSEEEIGTVAGLVDARAEVSFLGLRFTDSQKDRHEKECLEDALARLDTLRATHERQVGVTLVPRSIGPKAVAHGRGLSAGLPVAGEKALGFGSSLLPAEQSVVVHALGQQQPAVSQFDQIVYRAAVSVTYDVLPAGCDRRREIGRERGPR